MADTTKLSESLKFAEKIPVFKGLRPSQLRQLLNRTTVEERSPGDLLCEQGQESNNLYILLAGEVSVLKDGIELTRVGPVEMVGEMGLLTDRPRCATIQVLQPSKVMVISGEALQISFGVDPELQTILFRNVLDSVCEKLRESNLHLVENLHVDHGKIVASTV